VSEFDFDWANADIGCRPETRPHKRRQVSKYLNVFIAVPLTPLAALTARLQLAVQ